MRQVASAFSCIAEIGFEANGTSQIVQPSLKRYSAGGVVESLLDTETVIRIPRLRSNNRSVSSVRRWTTQLRPAQERRIS
jgi:hypothetical protein